VRIDREHGDAGSDGSSLELLHDWLGRWRTRLMTGFTVMLLLGLVASAGLRALYADVIHDLVPLQEVTTAAAMVDALKKQNGGRWPSDCVAPPPGKAIAVDPAASGATAAAPSPAASSPAGPVATTQCGNEAAAKAVTPVSVNLTPARLLLAVDSLLIVPGYLGWFMLSFAFLLPRANAERARVRSTAFDWHELLLQLYCLVPAAAAAFDLAENGITVLGMEDAISYVLADDLVVDMHTASSWKWLLFGASSAMTGAGAFWTCLESWRRRQRLAQAGQATSTLPSMGLDFWCLAAAAVLGPIALALVMGPSWTHAAVTGAMAAACAQWICVAVVLWRHPFPLQ
jgi:hypothetical protein